MDFERIERVIKFAFLGVSAVLVVAVGVALVIYAFRDDRRAGIEPVAVAAQDPAPVVTPIVEAKPNERDPVFVPEERPLQGASAEKVTRFATMAMHAVYDRCSKFYVFREGSRLEGDYIDNKRVWSNVAVHVADQAKAQGNVLWYRVYFDGDRPASIEATKTIAAELCGLPGKDIEVPIKQGGA